MKAIFDRVPLPKKFPLSNLLLSMCKRVPDLKVSQVAIKRIGGLGEPVWKYELILNEGAELSLEFCALEDLSLNPDAAIDELLCVSGLLCFGISDSSFMFIQTDDKLLESEIASGFLEVRDFPEISMLKK